MVLASEAEELVGVDVVSLHEGPSQKLGPEKFLTLLKRQFTPSEWRAIRWLSTPDKSVDRLYRHWAVKEVRGQGFLRKGHWGTLPPVKVI